MPNLQKQLDDEKACRALERTAKAGQMKRFLSMRINQPLLDILVALDMGRNDIAKQRVEMMLAAIKTWPAE